MKKLTEGPLVKLIFQFILPIMAMNLLQNLYNAADMVVVGYSGVPGALGDYLFAHHFLRRGLHKPRKLLHQYLPQQGRQQDAHVRDDRFGPFKRGP